MSTQAEPDKKARYLGCLFGGAVGDALGAPIPMHPLPLRNPR